MCVTIGPVPVGRFAPSPTGPLHVGNLRTALVAWLAARTDGSTLLLRSEDLDPASRPEHEEGQLADLRALGLEWDGPVVRQSERRPLYEDALSDLDAAGLTYPCYCTRREVREATRAPHGDLPEGAYPGTCRELTAAERAAREAEGRPPALRLRADGARASAVDARVGVVEGVVDDVVLRRNDGLPAYNLAVVVDDAAQQITHVIRGEDLFDATPLHVTLQHLLGLPTPIYHHHRLIRDDTGKRLAKRDDARAIATYRAEGLTPADLRARLDL